MRSRSELFEVYNVDKKPVAGNRNGQDRQRLAATVNAILEAMTAKPGTTGYPMLTGESNHAAC
jgi:hypothetical protein